MELGSANTPSAHYMALSEENVEQYLKSRRSWLWRKAIFVVRLVVKMSIPMRTQNEMTESGAVVQAADPVPSMGPKHDIQTIVDAHMSIAVCRLPNSHYINGLRLMPPLVNVNAYIQYIPPLSVCSAPSTSFVIGTCLFSGCLKKDEKIYGFI